MARFTKNEKQIIYDLVEENAGEWKEERDFQGELDKEDEQRLKKLESIMRKLEKDFK